jgi:hypothetical protein
MGMTHRFVDRHHRERVGPALRPARWPQNRVVLGFEPGVETVLAALIAVVGGFTGGWAKTWADHRYRLRRLRRRRRLASLVRLGEWLRTGTYDSVHLRMAVAEVGDRTLDASVDRLLNAADLHERDEALGAASHRIGELLARA